MNFIDSDDYIEIDEKDLTDIGDYDFVIPVDVRPISLKLYLNGEEIK